jgi:PIN domain nuclease of toxin-antitoxin system
MRLGRLRLPEPFAKGVADSGFSELPVRFAHAERAAELPGHHEDPFDRMLIAQAQVEGLTLVTHDRTIWQYDVPALRA